MKVHSVSGVIEGTLGVRGQSMPKAYGTLLVAIAVCCFCLQHGAAAMKVIGLGAGRTGTESLKAALVELGFGPTYHMVMRQNRSASYS